MRNLSLPAVALATVLTQPTLDAQASSPTPNLYTPGDHCDTYDRSIQFQIEPPTTHNGLAISRVTATFADDLNRALNSGEALKRALNGIDPDSLLLVHNAEGPYTEELLVVEVGSHGHHEESHLGVGVLELDFEPNQSLIPGTSVTICRASINDQKVNAALKAASRH